MHGATGDEEISKTGHVALQTLAQTFLLGPRRHRNLHDKCPEKTILQLMLRLTMLWTMAHLWKFAQMK